MSPLESMRTRTDVSLSRFVQLEVP